jgi:hypothetical protein
MNALRSDVDKIARDGYAVVERVVPAAEAASLKEQLELAMVEDTRGYGRLPGRKRTWSSIWCAEAL